MGLKAEQAVLFDLFSAALGAVDPEEATANRISVEGPHIRFGNRKILRSDGDLMVIAIGKAAIPMTNGALRVLGQAITRGVVVTKKGQVGRVDHPRIPIWEASHPVPDQTSVDAAAAVFDCLAESKPNDIVLFLISGGASALCTRPIPPLDLEGMQALSTALLASGCPIQELNTVRKQVDAVKGGGLGRAAHPAVIHTLVLSDVIGNPIAMIGSGPTVPNRQTPKDATEILKRAGIDLPDVVEVLDGLKEEDTSAPFESSFDFVGDIELAARAAALRAEAMGYTVELGSMSVEGEARKVGQMLAERAKTIASKHCLIMGGETTVTLQGNGIGGRNQECALAAAISLDGVHGVQIASFATDGDDGPTDAAGAIVDGRTIQRGRSLGLDADAYLENNDSYTYFKKLSDHLIEIGQTGTNVNDLMIVIRE